jgi:hypothetical protein
LNVCGILLNFCVIRGFLVVIELKMRLPIRFRMKVIRILFLGGMFCGIASAEAIPVLNFSGEINSGVDRIPLSDAAVVGWNGDGGLAQVIDGGSDYGNGRWRLSIEDSAEAWQMTSHGIAAGDSFSLRFDAAMFAGNLPGGGSVFVPGGTLAGGATRNGDFNDPAGVTGSRNFTDTPEWYNLGGSQAAQATNSDLAFDGTRNAVLTENGLRKFGMDNGHTLVASDGFQASFVWRDAGNWNDATDRGQSLFTQQRTIRSADLEACCRHCRLPFPARTTPMNRRPSPSLPWVRLPRASGFSSSLNGWTATAASPRPPVTIFPQAAPAASPSSSMVHCREARRKPSIAPAGVCLDTLMPYQPNLLRLKSSSA